MRRQLAGGTVAANARTHARLLLRVCSKPRPPRRNRRRRRRRRGVPVEKEYVFAAPFSPVRLGRLVFGGGRSRRRRHVALGNAVLSFPSRGLVCDSSNQRPPRPAPPQTWLLLLSLARADGCPGLHFLLFWLNLSPLRDFCVLFARLPPACDGAYLHSLGRPSMCVFLSLFKKPTLTSN